MSLWHICPTQKVLDTLNVLNWISSFEFEYSSSEGNETRSHFTPENNLHTEVRRCDSKNSPLRDENRFRGNFLNDKKEFEKKNLMGRRGRILAIVIEFVRCRSVGSLSMYQQKRCTRKSGQWQFKNWRPELCNNIKVDVIDRFPPPRPTGCDPTIAYTSTLIPL